MRYADLAVGTFFSYSNYKNQKKNKPFIDSIKMITLDLDQSYTFDRGNQKPGEFTPQPRIYALHVQYICFLSCSFF